MPARALAERLVASGVRFYFGVPDSVLTQFSAALDTLGGKINHTICANEGGAIAQAIGTFLASGEVAVAYMQNSGLGNAINPIVSMASADVASIPVLLVIGWRGEPGFPDEPQHVHQGRITLQLLELLDIPHFVVDETTDQIALIANSLDIVRTRRAPVALVVRRAHSAASSHSPHSGIRPTAFTRRQVLAEIISSGPPDAALVCTTGYTAREAHVLLKERGELHRALYVVGAMGHASGIALGISKRQPGRAIVCVDGDGAMVMHLGNLFDVSEISSCRFIHIVVNNGCHDSVGGQPIAGRGTIDLTKLAALFGYGYIRTTANADELRTAISDASTHPGPSFLEAIVSRESVGALPRPDESPQEATAKFHEFLLPTSL
jgi:phosphonopyruvate decarboxylase